MTFVTDPPTAEDHTPVTPTRALVGLRAQATQPDPLLDQHLAWCVQRNLRPETLKGKRGILRRLHAWLEVPLVDATVEQLEAWWATKSYMVASTRATELANVHTFYRWAMIYGHVHESPAARLPRPRFNQPLPRPVSETDVALAITQAPAHIGDWLTLAGYAGLRACEIAKVRSEHLDHTNAVLIIPDGKGGFPRSLPAHARILVRAERWPDAGPPWHTTRGEPYNANLVCKRANEYLREVGIAATLHKFRHRFGSRAYAVSKDIREAQELLGHRSLNSTLRYVALVDPHGRSTIDAL